MPWGSCPCPGCGDARVAPPCPTTLCVWRRLPYLTLPSRRQKLRVSSTASTPRSRERASGVAAVWRPVANSLRKEDGATKRVGHDGGCERVAPSACDESIGPTQVPRNAESTLSSAQVLKYLSVVAPIIADTEWAERGGGAGGGGEVAIVGKGRPWSTWSAVGNLTSRAGELRSAPSEPDDRHRATG